ncbi:MAG TPA: 1,4-alpha-glucan branching protein GlgB [Acidimicrobiales bacterium]|nr:1,4-alpha-glucan branching protein GlgB [Acidimicrobiales bacterium]
MTGATLGPLDLHLIGEGRHERLWEALGAVPAGPAPDDGIRFAVWAPHARSVGLAGDFNGWHAARDPLARAGESGVWERVVPAARHGDRYKFEIVGADGTRRLKADPMARWAETAPATASRVFVGSHHWRDDEWLADRPKVAPHRRRLSIYEVHLGSWRHAPSEHGPRPLTYLEAAEELGGYCTEMGFTHIELMPVAEHPFGGSWGYQVTGYWAPTSRFGTPDDFRAFVDTLHQSGVGVIVDWVPAHFPRDEWALARFDGTALYEHPDPRRGEHPDWDTLIFDHGRPEVRNFLIANALFWLEEFHVDGLRVDAVASMLYLDYSRGPGEWLPNRHGGRENLEAVSFLQECNTVVHRAHPGVLTIAEESTAWPGVSRPVDQGGLGFTHKWNMGWMHDTLEYFERDPIHRSYHHGNLTFGLEYAFSEHYVLPLSHDEVVHGKGSLIGKMPGDPWRRFANLRALLAWMWAHPGRQLLFMGGEIGQEREWNHDRSLDWHLLDDPAHFGVQTLVRELNALQASEPALWADDSSERGFRWLIGDDAAQSVLAIARFDPSHVARPVVCVANLTPEPRDGYRVGVPALGHWVELLGTDAARFGGSGVHATLDGASATDVAAHGHRHSILLHLPPLSVTFLAPQ